MLLRLSYAAVTTSTLFEKRESHVMQERIFSRDSGLSKDLPILDGPSYVFSNFHGPQFAAPFFLLVPDLWRYLISGPIIRMSRCGNPRTPLLVIRL